MSIDQKNRIQEISFTELKEMYPSVESGDWIAERQSVYGHLCWAVYAPKTTQTYNHFLVGFSSDPESIFFFESRSFKLIIDKASNPINRIKKALIEMTKESRRHSGRSLFSCTNSCTVEMAQAASE